MENKELQHKKTKFQRQNDLATLSLCLVLVQFSLESLESVLQECPPDAQFKGVVAINQQPLQYNSCKYASLFGEHDKHLT